MVGKRSKKQDVINNKRVEMVTPDGSLVWVPEKKVTTKESWGWKQVSIISNQN